MEMREAFGETPTLIRQQVERILETSFFIVSFFIVSLKRGEAIYNIIYVTTKDLFKFEE